MREAGSLPPLPEKDGKKEFGFMDDRDGYYDEYEDPGRYLAPHRGVMILVFGILGIVVCGFFAIPAWIMGNTDLAEMNAGRMDPSGRDLTNAGRIMGMIVGLLLIVSLGLGAMFLILGVILAAVGG